MATEHKVPTETERLLFSTTILMRSIIEIEAFAESAEQRQEFQQYLLGEVGRILGPELLLRVDALDRLIAQRVAQGVTDDDTTDNAPASN